MRRIISVFNEHCVNLKRIFSLGLSHAKKQTHRTSLGMGWLIIRDIINFASFIAFRTLMSGSREVDGMHFIVYIITGSVPWSFMNEVITGGAQAIKNNAILVKSIVFPSSIIPTIDVIAILFKKFFAFIIPFIVILIFGNISLFNPLLYIYYTLAMILFMVSYNLVFSAFNAVSVDFTQFYLSLTKLFFFMMPIIWSFDRLSSWPWLIRILKLNPMVYIITGFRDAFVHGTPPDLWYSIYFWCACIAIFMIGAYIQSKMAKYYSDFL